MVVCLYGQYYAFFKVVLWIVFLTDSNFIYGPPSLSAKAETSVNNIPQRIVESCEEQKLLTCFFGFEEVQNEIM